MDQFITAPKVDAWKRLVVARLYHIPFYHTDRTLFLVGMAMRYQHAFLLGKPAFASFFHSFF